MMAPKARWFTKEFRDARFGGNGSYALPESQARSPGSWGVARRPANLWLRSLSSPPWHSHSLPLTQPDGLKHLCRLNESSLYILMCSGFQTGQIIVPLYKGAAWYSLGV